MHLSPRVNKRVSAPFEIVYSDVWGPCPVMSLTEFKYFVTFVDDFSRVTWLYLMKICSELFSHFSAFYAEIQTQFHVTVRTLRSDNAKEYFSKPFQSFMLQHEILHQTSCVDTPFQNRVVERKNNHLLETTQALLCHMNVPKHFWADVVSTTFFLLTGCPHRFLIGLLLTTRCFQIIRCSLLIPRYFGAHALFEMSVLKSLNLIRSP